MGVWSNIKENVRDIGQGIVSVIKGKPQTSTERATARAEAEFEKARTSPKPTSPPESSYTPVKSPSGQVVYNSPFRSGGGGGGSSVSSSPTPTTQSVSQPTQQQVYGPVQPGTSQLPTSTYNAGKDIFQPTKVQPAFVQRAIQQQQMSRADLPQQSNYQQTPSISAYRKPTVAERIKQKVFNKREGFKTPTPSELQRAGYQRVTTPGTEPTYQGTIITDPTTGKPVKYQPITYETSTYISPAGEVFTGKSQTGRALTKFQVYEETLKPREESIRAASESVAQSKATEFNLKDQELFNTYQARANAGENIEKVQKEYEKDRNVLLKKSNLELQEQIKSDVGYQSAVRNYETTAKKLGADTKSTGEIFFPKLEKENVRWRDKPFKEKAIDIASFVPVTAPAIVLSKALKETQESPGYYTGFSGVKTTIKPGLSTDITKAISSTSIPVSTQISSLIALGVGGYQAYSMVRAATQTVNQEKALKVLNDKIQAGTFKPTASQLKTGEVTVKIFDDYGKQMTQKLKVPVSELKRAANQIAKRKEILRMNGLGDFRKVDVKLAGTTTERELIKDALSKEIQKNPELINKISTSEVGKFSGVTRTGKVTEGYILQTTEQVGDKGVSVSYVIKTTKAGGIKSVRVVKTSLDTGTKTLFRPAYPSETPIIKVPVKGSPQAPLEYQEINRLKAIKVLKGKGVSKQVVSDEGEAIARIIKKQSTLYDIGTPQGKGTTSVEQLFARGTPSVFRQKVPIPVSVSKSLRVEVLKKPKDILLSYSDDLATISKKLGVQRSGFVSEVGRVTEIPKPIKFTQLPKEFSKSVKGFSFETPIKTPAQVSNELVNLDKASSIILSPTKKISTQLSTKSVELDVAAALKSYERYPSIIQVGGKAVSKYAYPNFVSPTGIDFEDIAPQIKRYQKESVIELPKMSTKISSIDVYGKKIQPQRPLPQGIKMSDSNRRKNIFASTTIPNVKSLNEQLQINSPRLDVKQRTSQIQKLITQPPQKIKYPRLTGTLQPYPRESFGGGGFGLPPIPWGKSRGQGQQSKTKALRKAFKSTSDYSASLLSAFFQAKPTKVTRKQYAQLQKRTYSGVEIRPVLEIVSDKDFNKQIKKALSI